MGDSRGCNGEHSVVGDGAVYAPTLREAQLQAQKNQVGLGIATELIRDKTANSCDTLGTLPSSPAIDSAVDKLEAILGELRLTPPESIEALLLTEAQAAYTYFACW